MIKNSVLFLILGTLHFHFFSCKPFSNDTDRSVKAQFASTKYETKKVDFDRSINTIHAMVALCDNKYQGIVPVAEKLGNGQDPHNNLYWGALYGIKTHFKKSKEWKLISTQKVSTEILERVIFKHVSKNFYFVADAYDGKYIKQTTDNFLRSCAGKNTSTVKVDGNVIGIEGNAKLLAYIGHDGLMDFQLDEDFSSQDDIERDAIVLACYSKNFFIEHLSKAKANPLVWTTGLMAPEAYTLHDAISGFVNGEEDPEIRLRAAQAYSKYQKCSLSAAKNLLVTN